MPPFGGTAPPTTPGISGGLSLPTHSHRGPLFAEDSPRPHPRGFTLTEDSHSPRIHPHRRLTFPQISLSRRIHPRRGVTLTQDSHRILTPTHTLGMHPRRGGVKTRWLRNHPVRNVDFARPCLLFPMDNFPSFRVRVSMPFGRTHMF